MYQVFTHSEGYLVMIPNAKDGYIFTSLDAANSGAAALNAGKWFDRSKEKPRTIAFIG